MKPLHALDRTVRSLDGKGYRAYKAIQGVYDAGRFRVHVDHVQGDPFADPSRVRVVLAPPDAGYPGWARASADRRRATADFLNRRLVEAAERAPRIPGSGKSGEIQVLRPGQEVLDRTSVDVSPEGAVVARFRIGLPARGRRILGHGAAELLAAAARTVEASLFFVAVDAAALRAHVEAVEDAAALRAQLPERRLVAFVADGARLPRRSGIDDRPLEGDAVVPFMSPESLRVTLDAPNAGSVSGLGVPEGVTLIVGGGYHGKSTLLRALERGVYDHIPGDGREQVVTRSSAAKVRAEDGRRVAGTDISNFIGALPGGGDTESFWTENASGSTSQAASIVEALEAGAAALLLDEDTSATNFMIRDARMQRLVAAEDEPITPFIDRARALFTECGVSTVVVVGGSGDYFDVADTVVAMRRYRPADVTDAARTVAAELPTARRAERGGWRPIGPRCPLPGSMDPGDSRREVAIRVLARDRVLFGRTRVELGAVEQIVEVAQTRALAYALAWAREVVVDGRRTTGEVVGAVLEALATEGLGTVHPHELGELAAFREIELAAFMNRLRTLQTRPAGDGTEPDEPA
jgi:predicted ABC-class ATPase